jgi:hypothetical protein
MPGRLYAVSFTAVAVTAAQDFFEIAPADDKPVYLHALYLAQTTELGDAAEEVLRVSVLRGHTSSGSGGSTATPRPMQPSDTAFGGVAEVNNTTIASAGTAVELHVDGWNVRVPYQLVWTPETRPFCTQAQTTIVVRLMAAPADSVTVSGTLLVEELG